MSDKTKPKEEDKSKDDNNSINFRNAAIKKIKSLQTALDKEKKKKKTSSPSRTTVAATKLRGMRSFGEHSRASKGRNA
ncbi:MAG: hypothetical protein GY920_05530 [Aliivibrio sp.]|nr:hypothetical protein [Aliivibrio sp.]